MPSFVYFVKQESGLFRKGTWNVTLDRTTIGMYPDKDTALTAALGEADRTSYIGRESEVWVYEGDGFLLYKAFKPQKPPEEQKGGKKGKGQAEEDDSAFIDGDPAFDDTAYTADPSADTTSYAADPSTDTASY